MHERMRETHLSCSRAHFLSSHFVFRSQEGERERERHASCCRSVCRCRLSLNQPHEPIQLDRAADCLGNVQKLGLHLQGASTMINSCMYMCEKNVMKCDFLSLDLEASIEDISSVYPLRNMMQLIIKISDFVLGLDSS